MKQTAFAIAAIALLTVAGTTETWSQRAGQSVTIQYGTVTAAREVDLNSGAVPAGAVVGGALGLASGSSGSTSRRARNAIIGAAAGGAIAGASQGSRRGMLYDIDIGAGGRVQVVSDQREIRQGDCVAVERAGDTANVRRVSAAFCDRANEAAVQAVADDARGAAEKCASAKQELVDATTREQADLAERKITLLCND